MWSAPLLVCFQCCQLHVTLLEVIARAPAISTSISASYQRHPQPIGRSLAILLIGEVA